MTATILSGSLAHSSFREAALLASVRGACQEREIARITATYVYFLQPAPETGGVLPGQVLERSHALLSAVGPFDSEDGFFVIPRKGTISPWSSKATDIFRNCGLHEVRRVERGIHYCVEGRPAGGGGAAAVLGVEELGKAIDMLHDRMTEGVYVDVPDLFAEMEPAHCVTVDVLAGGTAALAEANVAMGLALDEDEIEYLCDAYRDYGRNPTDVELVMFGQVNSEHCRHKIFNADWRVDGEPQERSLFSMIRNTHETHPRGTLVAYSDNSGVLEGHEDEWFEVSHDGTHRYHRGTSTVDMVMKVETHNHPTAISPFPGAATGVGGEIRDESATGVGGKSKAGLSGYMVSNLRVPGFVMPWERDYAPFPARLASPLEIMTDGPIGGAGFGNEFGRPQLSGLFRTYEHVHNGRYRGYHKPIMVAGGMGNIKRDHVRKSSIGAGARIIQIGGPAMRIGLGGGAASSMATGSNAAELDFDSVQRDNAEMERRCQEVIDACIALGDGNPILSIHDIGAGGLSNGCPELVADVGGRFGLRDVHNEDLSMSPMEIWCCEAQERYVLAVPADAVERFLAICARERCPAAVIGEATGDHHLRVDDSHFGDTPIDIDLGVILGRPPRMLRDVRRETESHAPLDLGGVSVDEAAERVLRLPAVADKTFLITIADRSVTGMVARDQMTGPYQVPISDVAVTTSSYVSYMGEAMAMGERTPVALVSAPASGRMAVGEALTNIAAADVGEIGNVKLSANWMCACGEPGEDARLFDTVKAVGMELCPALGISIPVGKDSLSMRTLWQPEGAAPERMTAPLSLVVSAFAPVADVRRTVTQDMKPGASRLLLLDLGNGQNRLGCSSLAQVFNQVGDGPADLDDPSVLLRFFAAVQELVRRGLLLAYHDRSDGGLFVTLAEMAFGGRCGLAADVTSLGGDPLAALFSEELGAVLQVGAGELETVTSVLADHGLADACHDVGAPNTGLVFEVCSSGEAVFSRGVLELQRIWSELTYHMQSGRDNPECAREEFDRLLDGGDPGMTFRLTYAPAHNPVPESVRSVRPRMAVLREQGINGHVEMAAAFDTAGFECVDVHMTDLLSGRTDLAAFSGLVACGGFSYGDVLGAGAGWAKSVLYNDDLKTMFVAFFGREDTFALGVCNGCQMMAQLKEIIPGAEHWPEFTRNRSEQFEARYVTVEIMPSPSILLRGMEGTRAGVPVAHGEGFADFERSGSLVDAKAGGLVSLRYVDNRAAVAEKYPLNPNGSPEGITGMTTRDGRVTIMMPHPERVFRAVQMSYRPAAVCDGEDGPWLRMFRNARAFVG